MIDELNKIIAAEDIKINPFNERGFSSNQYVNEVFFLFCDEQNKVLRLYTNVIKIDSYTKEQAAVLRCLLQFNGPQVAYPDLKVGMDLNSDFLWISSAFSFEFCSQGSMLKERIEAFRTNASALREKVISKIEETLAQIESSTSSTAASAPVANSQPLSNSANHQPAKTVAQTQSEELVQLMTNTQMYWG